jgi:peptidoglycan-N-acetylglucosamine deacetylase
LARLAAIVGKLSGRALSNLMSDSLVRTMQRPWRPVPMLVGSAALHVTAIAATALRPHLWPWSLGAIAADHLLLAGIGLWPRSTLLGSNWRRLPQDSAIAITIDDGPDPEVTPRVLDVLDEHGGAKATFFCIGENVLRFAPLAREIVRRGHVIENHSQRHVHHFSVMGLRGLSQEVGHAQESIATTVGSVPRFFRAPAGLRNLLLDPVLTRFDLQLASWTRRGFDTVNRDPDAVLSKLTGQLGGGDILLLHDGHAARTRSGQPVILEVLPRLLQAMSRLNLRPITLRAALP